MKLSSLIAYHEDHLPPKKKKKKGELKRKTWGVHLLHSRKDSFFFTILLSPLTRSPHYIRNTQLVIVTIELEKESKQRKARTTNKHHTPSHSQKKRYPLVIQENQHSLDPT
jgi:hypothetical protein